MLNVYLLFTVLSDLLSSFVCDVDISETLFDSSSQEFEFKRSGYSSFGQDRKLDLYFERHLC